jgi:AcrR family transcriptional regulator
MVAMGEPLNAEKWVDFGLDALRAQGFRALKADSLARALKVSRGSFYWHFADIDAFHRAVVEAWRRRSTERVIERLDAMPETAARLPELLSSAFSTGDSLEKAMRAWALSLNPIAVSAVAEVDAIRVRYIERLLVNANLPAEEVRARALVLYWAYVGRAMSADQGLDALAPVLSQLIRFAFGGDDAKGVAVT